MNALEKVSFAVRLAGFGKFASHLVRAEGDEPPTEWDVAGAFGHLGAKVAHLSLLDAAVDEGVRAAASVGVKLAAAAPDFTSEFHSVNRLATGLDKTASAGAARELATRRLALWRSMKSAAARTSDELSGLAKIAIRVWSETERSGDKTASTRDEREAFALAFASNAMVDEKIASLHREGRISLDDAVKLSHLTAEAAMDDLEHTVGSCRAPNGSIKRAGFFDRFKKKPKQNKPDPDAFDFTHDRLVQHAPGTALYPAEDGEDESGDLGYFTHEAHPGRKAYVSLGNLFDDVSVRGDDVYKDIHKHFTNHGPLPHGVSPEEMKNYKKAAVDPRLIGLGVGAAGGAAIGAVSDKDNRLRGAGMGAVMGAPVGALGGQVVHELMNRKGDAVNKAKDLYNRMSMYGQKMGPGNVVSGALKKHEQALTDAFHKGKPLPVEFLSELTPRDMDELVKLDRAYGGNIFKKADAMPQVTAQPGMEQPPSPHASYLADDTKRKGEEGLHRMRAYASALGNGIPELVEQHAEDIIGHFGEGRKDVPPVLAAKFGPGIIDQMLALKKTYSTPVI